VVKSVLTVTLLHEIAEALTSRYSEENPLHKMIHDLVGGRAFLWYCIDMSDTVWKITFSDVDKPRLLLYQGLPAAIASNDAADLEVYAEQTDMILPGRLRVREYPHFITLT
jgi:hypothetical protein